MAGYTVTGYTNNLPVTLETGILARQANGSVLLTCQDLVLLATATMSQAPKPGCDFLPLMVDFQEKSYAAGKIPGGFIKRESRPSTTATLTARLIDRALRPGFVSDFNRDVHVVVTVLSYDQSIDPAPLAIIAASAALGVSDIPFVTPISAVQCIETTQDAEKETGLIELDAIIAGSHDAIFMIEAAANEQDESVIMQAVINAHEMIKADVSLQTKLIEQAGKPKIAPDPHLWDDQIATEITQLIQPVIQTHIGQSSKSEFSDCLADLETIVHDHFSHLPDYDDTLINRIYATCKKQVIRREIIGKQVRPDGRQFDEIRPISTRVGLLPAVHGSAVFTRGETQSLSVLTLGSTQDAQVKDSLKDNEPSENYLFHYNFPPFSVGETGFMGRLGRRELGHGALAGRGIQAILPTQDDFSYTIRLVSEILESNGSSSMASVCAGCLALMDGGVPIKRPVSGIAMGLLLSDSGHAILSDIQGLEDHYGDMDFKVVRSAVGITALQLDIKVAGLSIALLREALAQAKAGCANILTSMIQDLSETRTALNKNAPRLESMQVDPKKVGAVIGSGGSTIRKIEQDSGASVSIDSDSPGRIVISAKTDASLRIAQDMIAALTRQAAVGDVYTGRVAKVAAFGVFVDLFPGCTGLAHISKFKKSDQAALDQLLKPGDTLSVKVVSLDRDKVALVPTDA